MSFQDLIAPEIKEMTILNGSGKLASDCQMTGIGRLEASQEVMQSRTWERNKVALGEGIWGFPPDSEIWMN
jgi:hypothetical protein